MGTVLHSATLCRMSEEERRGNLIINLTVNRILEAPSDLESVNFVSEKPEMTFSEVIGKYVESSGLSDIWEESVVFGETTADNILKEKIWNRVRRAHKLYFEALWRVLWSLFETWCEENSKEVDSYSQQPAKRLAEEFFSKDVESKQLAYISALKKFTSTQRFFEEFDGWHKEAATFCFWRTYMRLVFFL